MLISPTEPKVLRDAGVVSSVPEQYGADIIIPVADVGMIGVQRKEVKDYVGSVRDGRLGGQIAKMKSLQRAVLILEGDFRWDTNGVSAIANSWSLAHFLGSLLSLQSEGCWVIPSNNLAQTIELLSLLTKWIGKKEHQGLLTRPSPRNEWGRVTNEDWAVHFLMGIEGIGKKQARRIVEKFGGVPMKWTVGIEELMEVDGIGFGRAERMMSVFSEVQVKEVLELEEL